MWLKSWKFSKFSSLICQSTFGIAMCSFEAAWTEGFAPLGRLRLWNVRYPGGSTDSDWGEALCFVGVILKIFFGGYFLKILGKNRRQEMYLLASFPLKSLAEPRFRIHSVAVLGISGTFAIFDSTCVANPSNGKGLQGELETAFG